MQILAGMIGDRPPQSALFEPSWHHIYAVLGWTDLTPLVEERPHYPATAPERAPLTGAIFRLVSDPAARAAFRDDPGAYAAGCELAEEERAALAALDRETLRDRFAINPMLLYQLENRVSSGS